MGDAGESRSGGAQGARTERTGPAPDAVGEARGPAQTGAARAPLILVVDDDPQMLRFIGHVLEKRFRVSTAPDGEAGLAAALQLVPDLILTDLMMPRMSGEQLVREIRRRPALEGVPVMLLSAWSDDEMRVRMLREGALDYISKPFYADELLTRVANLVAQKRARELLRREVDIRDRDLDALADEVVTRKRQLETALETARLERDKAERASRAKSDLLGLVSHELMTPVAALRLIAQRMERDKRAPLAPVHLALVRRMIALSVRLGGAIESLLEYARLEAGPRTVQEEPVDLLALVGEVVEELRPQAEEKGLELRVLPEADLTPVLGDRRLLRMIVANLASNAIKFTEAGWVGVKVWQAHGAHRLSVQDTGPGIPADERERIFEPFHQLEPLLHKHKPGIGLGLALAREAAAALGGRIELRAEDPGSTFTVTLPQPGVTLCDIDFREQESQRHATP
jgi:signal transduction histidine kinase